MSEKLGYRPDGTEDVRLVLEEAGVARPDRALRVGGAEACRRRLGAA